MKRKLSNRKKIQMLVEKIGRKKHTTRGDAELEHIRQVVKNAKILAKKLHADEEVVEIAAWLHDYAWLINMKWDKVHHIKGAELARQILKKYGYSKQKIEEICHCIHAHRSSYIVPRNTIEAEIIASADSMAHFDQIGGLLYFFYISSNASPNEGVNWLLAKLKRDWKKLLPEGKKICRKKYEAIRFVFES